MQIVARLFERLFRARLSIHKHNDIFHHQPNPGQFFDGFELASAGGGKVINDHHGFTGMIFPFDIGFGAVGLYFFARVDHGVFACQTDGSGNGNGSIRETCNAVELQVL